MTTGLVMASKGCIWGAWRSGGGLGLATGCVLSVSRPAEIHGTRADGGTWIACGCSWLISALIGTISRPISPGPDLRCVCGEQIGRRALSSACSSCCMTRSSNYCCFCCWPCIGRTIFAQGTDYLPGITSGKDPWAFCCECALPLCRRRIPSYGPGSHDAFCIPPHVGHRSVLHNSSL